MDYKEITNRIDELNLDGYKEIKNNDWKGPNQLMGWLNERNFKVIGEGAYSSVWKSDTEKFIVKINNGYGLDEGYLKFVDFCHKNKNNPHLPKMGKIKKYKDWYIVFIEKLEPTYLDYTVSIGLKRFVRYFFGPNTSLQHDDLTDKDMFEKLFKRKASEYKLPDELKSQDMIDALFVLFKFIVEYNINDMSLDLHGGNIMLRGNTIVITDPVT